MTTKPHEIAMKIAKGAKHIIDSGAPLTPPGSLLMELVDLCGTDEAARLVREAYAALDRPTLH